MRQNPPTKNEETETIVVSSIVIPTFGIAGG